MPGCDGRGRGYAYRAQLDAALAGFNGTVISGGTLQGISGLVGEIGSRRASGLRTIGYLPATLPTDGTATIDDRYHEKRRTTGQEEFSALEPLQNWIDILCSGIAAKDVRVLGINGGDIAGLEYRFALALGASVAVIEGSGREAEQLVKEWPLAPKSRLTVVPNDPMTLRAFVHGGEQGVLSDEQIEEGAQSQHAGYLEKKRYDNLDPTMRLWPKLGKEFKESNRDQIRYIESVLRANGFRLGPIGNGGGIARFDDPDLVKRMAEMEHGRWNLERLQQGWKLGPRSPEKKTSPYLVPWANLTRDVQKWDHDNVYRWPEILAKLGVAIYPMAPEDAAPQGTLAAEQGASGGSPP